MEGQSEGQTALDASALRDYLSEERWRAANDQTKMGMLREAVLSLARGDSPPSASLPPTQGQTSIDDVSSDE